MLRHVVLQNSSSRIPKTKSWAGSDMNAEQESNKKVFTSEVIRLLAILKQWEDEGVRHPIALDLPTFAVSPPNHIAYQCSVQCKRFCFQLDRHSMLPKLTNVRELSICRNHLAPSAGLQMATRLPMLNRLYLTSKNYENHPADMQYRDRANVIDALTNVQLQSRSKLSQGLNYVNRKLYMQKQDVSCMMLQSELSYNPISSMIHVLSFKLTTLTLSAFVDSTLFWPSANENNGQISPSWPFLRKFHRNFGMVAPTGEAYFAGLSRSQREEEEEDGFQMEVCSSTMGPFLAALAKAVPNMPAMDGFTLECRHDWSNFSITYMGPGQGIMNM